MPTAARILSAKTAAASVLEPHVRSYAEERHLDHTASLEGLPRRNPWSAALRVDGTPDEQARASVHLGSA